MNAVVCDYCGKPSAPDHMQGWFRCYRVDGFTGDGNAADPTNIYAAMFGRSTGREPRWSAPTDFCSDECMRGWAANDRKPIMEPPA